MIILCVALALWSSLGSDLSALAPFFISYWPPSSPDSLIEVRHGEIWRLFTPAFIHFGVVHLLVNMRSMQILGSLVEWRHGSLFYLVFSALLAVATNLVQYYFAGPAFGGMSGVLYGLFGYVWLRSVCDPAYGIYMPRKALLFALAFYALCLSGFLPVGIANAAHTAGLVLGAIAGAIAGRIAVSRAAGRSKSA